VPGDAPRDRAEPRLGVRLQPRAAAGGGRPAVSGPRPGGAALAGLRGRRHGPVQRVRRHELAAAPAVPAALRRDRGVTVTALGGPLGPDDVVGVARAGWRVTLSDEAERRVSRGRAFVERLAEGDALAYGITTGVGKLKDVRIPPEARRALQLNL